MTRFFPIEHGIGYGSVRVTVLFRPVRASLPRNLLGFDSGTLHIRKVEFDGAEEHISNLKKCWSIAFYADRFGWVFQKGTPMDSSDGVEWVEEKPLSWSYESAIARLFQSYQEHWFTIGEEGYGRPLDAGFSDNEDKVVDVPLWRTDDF